MTNPNKLEWLNAGASWLRSHRWLARAVPRPLQRLLRRRLFTADYALKLAEWDAPVKNAPAESNYPPAYPGRVGIIRDLFWNHTSYIAACRDLKVAYRVLDIFRSDWVDQFRNSGCTAFVAWPSESIPEWKRLYDERLRFLTEHLAAPLYPSFDALWLYGSKQRQRDWLDIRGFPHAASGVFYRLEEALAFIDSATMPLVAKLDIGAAANGVWIARTPREARALARRAFDRGLVGERSDARSRQWRHILFQEYLPGIREWRMIRIGESYLGHEKGKADQFHSGSGVVGWFAPPRQALELLHALTEAGGFRSMAMDVFETPDGRFLVNELQTVFGARDTAQMYINGVPGRYRRLNGKFFFEEGRFCVNACCNLRIEDLMKMMSERPVQAGKGRGQ